MLEVQSRVTLKAATVLRELSPRRPASLLETVVDAWNSPLAKRTFDVVAASLLLVALAPLLLLVAVLIKLRDGGPVFFLQQRFGRDCRKFWCFKFRSMTVDAPARQAQYQSHNVHSGGITFKIKNDPRVTWIGWIIRKLSIDEMPQLWNVIKGDMSLVGPRPPVPEEVARYRRKHFGRLSVLPGITCFWQVEGRANLGFDEQFLLDMLYIKNRTMWLDIYLLLRTIPAVLSCRGAY
jgi:lipopolysaccharide/colanic/teichoic acid biosynthesis glycosyltransferase